MERKMLSEEVKYLQLPELAELAIARLRESRAVERASSSALYKKRWKDAGVKPGEIRTYEDLRTIPFVTSEDLKKAFIENRPEDISCSDHVRLWFSTSGTTGSPKWIPYSDKDIALIMEIGNRNRSLFSYEDGLVSLGLSAPAPFFSDAAPYLGIINSIFMGRHREVIAISFSDAKEGLSFGLRRKPQIFSAFPSVAMRIAEGIAEEASRTAKQRLNEHVSLKNFIAYLVTRFKKIKPKYLVKFKSGFFAGEPLEPFRQALKENYGFEPYDIYAFTECLHVSSECPAKDGVHLWMDICMPELITEEELDKEEDDPNHVPEAIPLWEAKPGAKGEFVITTFGDALPLIRYRVSDLIKVISTERCKCGVTHPRIKVLRRLGDIVNMGLVRFSIYELDAKLTEVKRNGQVHRWQLRILREGYKPKPLLLVEPKGEVIAEKFEEEILNDIFEFKQNLLREAYENGLIARPIVKLVERFEEAQTSTGKLKRVIYEGVE